MLDLIAPEVRDRRSALRRQFRRAEPYPHLVIDRFLAGDFCASLEREFPPFERGSSLDENGRPGGKAVVEDLRALGGAFARADALFAAPEFLALMSELTGIPGLLYDPDYVGGGTHENRAGQELDPHVDFNYHPRTRLHRRVNLIVYLNPQWEEGWGGALELHRDPWAPPRRNPVKRVVPLANRAILFETSERSWHGFEAIRPPADRPALTRRSLAIYLYTRERPAAETAPAHSTVYVERPLPDALRAGVALTFGECAAIRRLLERRVQHVERLGRRERELAREALDLVTGALGAGRPLAAADVELVRRIVAREDELLKSHYDREKEINRDLAALRARSDGPAAPELRVGGCARLAAPAEGYYPGDQWGGPHMAFTIAATGAASCVVLHGFLAAAVPPGQVLTVRAGGATHERALTPGAFEWRLPVALAPGDRLTLSIDASRALVPRDGGGDQRTLAFQLLGVDVL